MKEALEFFSIPTPKGLLKSLHEEYLELPQASLHNILAILLEGYTIEYCNVLYNTVGYDKMMV